MSRGRITKIMGESWGASPLCPLLVLKHPVSFASADQRRLLCPRCERLFMTTNTQQRYCSLLCAAPVEPQP